MQDVLTVTLTHTEYNTTTTHLRNLGFRRAWELLRTEIAQSYFQVLCAIWKPDVNRELQKRIKKSVQHHLVAYRKLGKKQCHLMDLSFISNCLVSFSDFPESWSYNKMTKWQCHDPPFNNTLTNIKHCFAVLDRAEGYIRTYPSVNME